MKQSTNYNMNKPDPNDMFSLEHWNQNTDKIDETLAPTFEDYTGETPVPTTDEALKNIKSKTKLSILMQNIKAFCKGCCTLGMLVDNCVTNNNNLPLAASQGKILMDQITSLNSDLGYYITSEDDFSHTLIGGAAQNITLNSKITLEQYTRILFLNYPGSNDGALLAIAPGDKIITAFRNNGVWEEKSSQFIATKSDLFSNLIKVTDIHNIRKSCLFRAEYGAANTPTKNVGYIGLSVYVDRTWHFVICSPYSGGKLFFDSVNTSGSWIGWKEIAFK